ncbi:hypothetical protein [Legionella genomosp. 1]|uniref:hypothetical protein n=1 Tax=Legionella genomosp. 1 TaxID=1093625 RepID=UPI0013EF6B33|nr:hypothetical protein [Legionella genomosp. 1]
MQKDRYVVTKLRAEQRKDTAGLIHVYYKLLHSFDPQKPTLLVINGGPGGDHNLIELFFLRGRPGMKRVSIQ